ncbi:efflux RND transporter periplasmic adaptor subunit [Neiella marina]|uniref:Efflux RND transporter periplasmic adaptor subunit n=1 Tax=Neiella holothuriorum TaxID=2870530 RepID=A0ABS7EJA6_9GAMM|nr:efflux RND transporter periplasmic adaptor subunit [Neiella holothuriorum]MBW8191737.1 efflux RND transporter periplasmic adaptor subunit [Neiella holothuriorum]
MKLNNKLAIAVGVCSAVFLSACSKAPAPEKMAPPVETVKISDDVFGTQRDFPAVVQASDQSDLAFRVSGELISLPAIGGKQVKKGDVLAKLDPADFVRAVEDASATYDLAKVNYERAAALLKTGSISASEHDTLKAEYEIAKADLGIAKVRLDFTELKAPKDGVIGLVAVDNFENVQVGEPIVTINSMETIDIVIDVAEHLLAVANPRASQDDVQHQVTIEGIEGVFYASRYEVESEKDDVSKTYKATLRMKRPERTAILPGMSAVVRVDMNKVSRAAFSGLVLPGSAVLFEPSKPLMGDNAFVWKLSEAGNSVVKQPVEVEQLAEFGVEIKSGIAPGDVIVVYGQGLSEGAAVNVVKTREIKG